MKPGDETINDFRGLGRDPLIGVRVDDYEVQSIIGTGAMGIVYRVQHAVIGKPAALKVLRPDYADDPEMVQRLVREARTVNAIRHPGIVDIFGFGTLPNGQPYIVMDLLEGEPLDSWVKREAPAPFKKVGPILDEILGALYAAHQVGVIHRDLKPGNIFFESHPESRGHVKIIDFGLARQADRAGGSIRPTNPGTLIGTPAFMAPEQVLGIKVYPATDLYAVGGIAYQMLTGRIPHEAPSAIEVISQKMKFDPVPPRQWVPSLDPDVDSWVMMLLDRDPERRPESADDARRMLRRLVDVKPKAENKLHPPAARPPAATTLVNPSAVSSPSPAPRKYPGVPTPQPKKAQGAAGAVPKRGWSDAKTVLVDPAVAAAPAAAPSNISDSSVISTDPLRHAVPQRPGNETLLQPPDPPEVGVTQRNPPVEIGKTQPVPPVNPKLEVSLSFASQDELKVPKSNAGLIVMTVVGVALLIAALIYGLSR